jgi:hypothetical protein
VAESLAGGAGDLLAPVDRAWQVRDALLEKSGTRGDILIDVAKFLVFARAFARGMGWPGIPMPMRAGVFAIMVRGKHALATAAAVGARGGETVGARFRATGISMANNLCFPIEYDHPAVWGAAPSAKAGGGRQRVAATAPLKLSIHVMRKAREAQPSPGRFTARSAVFSELTGSRVQEAERLELMLDEQDPEGVMRGYCYMAKDGEPIELFAPARDYLGRIDWWREHVEESMQLKGERGGVAFRRWHGPHGCKSDIYKAAGLLAEVASRGEIRDAIFAVWAQPPLSLGKAQRKLAGVRGHSLHGSAPDAMGFIGEHPVVPYELAEDLKRGFTAQDVRRGGNWRREASQGPQAPTRVGRAPAEPPGAPDARAQSEHVYGRGEGRLSDRRQQISVRMRLCRFVETALRAWGVDTRPLSEMPEGNADWALVVPEPGA